jgi:hypothetical protein
MIISSLQISRLEVCFRRHFQAGSAEAFRRGRRSSSPAQFGQTCCMCSVHFAQNVHSNEQINARSPAPSVQPHFSHAAFISSVMVRLARLRGSK